MINECGTAKCFLIQWPKSKRENHINGWPFLFNSFQLLLFIFFFLINFFFLPLASYKICRLRYTHIIRLLEQLHWIREVRGAGTLLEQVPTRWSSAVAAQLWFAMNAAHVTMHSRTKALSLPLPISLTMRQHNVKPDCFFFFWTASIWFFLWFSFAAGKGESHMRDNTWRSFSNDGRLDVERRGFLMGLLHRDGTNRFFGLDRFECLVRFRWNWFNDPIWSFL